MPQSRPNVVVFFTDQQRWDTCGVHGNPLELTPNFDRIAKRGTHLHHMFTCQPVCGPARACLQTGVYPVKLGCWHNDIPLPPAQKTLAHYFREGGYTTGYIGKWHLSVNRQGQAVPVVERGGYEYWLGADSLENCSDAYRAEMFDGENRKVLLPGYRVDGMTDAGIRYIEAQRQRPFFLFMSFLEPHFQNHLDNYPAPDGYEERYTGRWMPPDLLALRGSAPQHLAGYFGMCKRLDEAFGRVLDALKSLGILQNTIVLFTSDHGCHFKTRNSEYKRSCHESSIRVPAALQGGPFDGGGQIQQLVSLIDLPPTLLDACGLPISAEMQGRSALPLVQRRNVEWPEEMFVQISEAQIGRAVRTQRWKYCVSAPADAGGQSGCAEQYTEECLYDLHADPHELTNLIGLDSHAGVVLKLRERLVRRMKLAGEALPGIVAAPARPKGGRRVFPGEELQ